MRAAGMTEEQQQAYRLLQGLHGPLRSAIMAEPAEVRRTRDSILTTAVRHESRLASESNRGGNTNNTARAGPSNFQGSSSKLKAPAKLASRPHANRPKGQGSSSSSSQKKETAEKEKGTSTTAEQ